MSSVVPQLSRVGSRAEEILAASGLWENPYFSALTGGAMSLAGFRASQEQFYHAVAFFSRPMAGLVARLPDYASRIDILHNVVEEHGDFSLRAAHATTFAAFLQSLGSTPAEAIARRPAPCVHAFNNTLYAACLLEELPVGIATLGVIEHAFARLSAQLGQATVARGWVSADKLVHYALHAELDIRHAEEFFRLLESQWDQPATREPIERGLALGAYAFDRLYRDLWALSSAP